MILDNSTASKVANLLSIPINTVEYNGSWSEDCVNFLVGVKNKNGDWVSGVSLYVTQNLQIKKVSRIKISVGRFTRNYPVRKYTLPFITV